MCQHNKGRVVSNETELIKHSAVSVNDVHSATAIDVHQGVPCPDNVPFNQCLSVSETGFNAVLSCISVILLRVGLMWK